MSKAPTIPNEVIFEDFKKKNKEIKKIGKNFDKEGKVKEVNIDNKTYIGKICDNKEKGFYEEKLRGTNIAHIYKIFKGKIAGKEYNLVLTEKALLKDLKTMNDSLHAKNLLKLIYNPFYDIVGNSFMKYYTKQIVNALEILERNDMAHFNIKAENILISRGLKLKLSDFYYLMLLKNTGEKKDEGFSIPEINSGYTTPEYFTKTPVDKETAKKQDYFAFGATLYLLKMGEQMLEYKSSVEDAISEDRIIDFLQRDIAKIQSYPLFDKTFVDFICRLIGYIPKERPTFEEIYREKWLNENIDEVFALANNTYIDGDDSKIMRELNKSDFLLERKKQKPIKKRKFNLKL